MTIDRREFVKLGAGALLSARGAAAAGADSTKSMLAPLPGTDFSARVLLVTGDNIGGYRPPGIMDGMGAWQLDESTVRLFVNHELPPDAGYIYRLENGAGLRGARISWFDIDRESRQITAAGNAIKSVRDRRGESVSTATQVNELWGRTSLNGLNMLCSAQGFRESEFGFVDDLLFTHEEVSAVEDHPHGGSIWCLDIHSGELWALSALGRGSWENLTAVATPDQSEPDGHIALLLSDDLEFGAAPLYLWLGRKRPGGSLPERNGLVDGQLHVWVAEGDARSPQDWHGTGSRLRGRFVPITARDAERAGQPGHDRDGYLDDPQLRSRARELGAFMFSRPEDLHTNPAEPSSVVWCSTGHGGRFPADDWGTVYRIDTRIESGGERPRLTATLTILHDCDDFGDYGIRSADNVVWASDGMIYIHEDMANKLNTFGADSGREASTWRLDPADPRAYTRIAEIDRSVVLPADSRDIRAGATGAWECCGLIDVSDLFAPGGQELLFITAVQAHSIRGGALGGRDDLYQGGQLILLSGTR